jgi:hypothetical protein
MPASLATASPVARYWLPAMSRKKSDLRLAPGANSVGASAVSRRKTSVSASPTAFVASLQVLLRAEVALELAEEAVELAVQRAGACERLPEQEEAAVDEGLLLGDGGRSIVVRARIRDAAPEHVAVLIHDDRLGCRGAEIDADEAAHAGSLSARRRPRWPRASR